MFNRLARPFARLSDWQPCRRRHFTDSGLARHLQSYVSSSTDPYLNLSIEHHLLQNTHRDSAVLLFYTNRPSVIIGRNQNPWSEVNHAFVRRHGSATGDHAPDPLKSLDLVRRRSGGGTVFHDPRNVNWSVICPSSVFTRDRHAEMVVRALRSCGVERARVNERHDIVLDQGRSAAHCARDDTHITAWTKSNPPNRGALKVSGSAYKLTRGRALHHGTALLDSANLRMIPHILHSPAKEWIKGRGVDSVPSPVGNLGLRGDQFIAAVQREFEKMYGSVEPEVLGEDCLGCDGVRRGYEELKSAAWTYLQTPQFTISNRDADDSLLLPGVKLTVRNGVVTRAEISIEGVPTDRASALAETLQGRALHEIRDWFALFDEAGVPEGAAFANWLEGCLLGK